MKSQAGESHLFFKPLGDSIQLLDVRP